MWRARGVRARQEACRAERARHRLQRDEGCMQQPRARDEVGVRMHNLRTCSGLRLGLGLGLGIGLRLGLGLGLGIGLRLGLGLGMRDLRTGAGRRDQGSELPQLCATAARKQVERLAERSVATEQLA